MRTKRTLYSIVFIGFLIRLIYALYFWNKYGLTVNVDQKDYLQYANQILAQGIFVPDYQSIDAFSAPGYPWLLSFFLLIGRDHLIVAIVANVLASTLLIILFIKFAKNFLDEKFLILATIWVSVYIPFIIFNGSLLKEVWLQLFFIVSMFLLYRAVDPVKMNWKALIILALAVTFLFHVDERYFLYIPMILIPFATRLQKKLKPILILSGSILLFTIPWFVRNYIVYERPVLLTERFQSPVDKMTGYSSNRLLLRQKDYKKDLISFRDSLKAGLHPTPNSGRERKIKEALEMGLYPGDFTFTEKLRVNFVEFWSPVSVYYRLTASGWKLKGPRSWQGNLVYGVLFGLLIPLSLIGIYYAIGSNNFWILYFASLLIYHTLIHTFIISAMPRYRFPLDSILILIAFYGLQNLATRFHAGNKQVY